MKWKAPDMTDHRMDPIIYDGINNGPQVGYDHAPDGEVIWWSIHEAAMERCSNELRILRILTMNT